jgi:retron-type reverse transcriptase
VDWINPTGARKVHSLIDKVYQRKNLEMAWEMVKANRGSGGVDGQSLEGFAAQLDQQLDRLQSELKENVYRPQPVRQVQIPKAGKPGEFRTLGIPTIYDRVCQQALLNWFDKQFHRADGPSHWAGPSWCATPTILWCWRAIRAVA